MYFLIPAKGEIPSFRGKIVGQIDDLPDQWIIATVDQEPVRTWIRNTQWISDRCCLFDSLEDLKEFEANSAKEVDE